MRALVIAATLAFVGCGQVIGEDFEGYSEDHPVEAFGCDPANPHDASRRFDACDSAETCMFAGPDGTVDMTRGWAECIEAFDWKPLGASCTYANECGTGAFCSPVLGCSRFCHVGASCADGATCLAFEPAVQANGVEIGYCAPPPCDPVASDCSGTCGFYQSERTACFLDSGSGTSGASCNVDTDCQPHLACDDVAKHCTQYCRVDGDDCGGKKCIATNDPPLFHHGKRYGYCEL